MLSSPRARPSAIPLSSHGSSKALQGFPISVTAALPATPSQEAELLQRCASACVKLKREVARAVVGQDDVVDALLVTLLARGHALLVGVPGLAKTLLVSSMARALSLSFGRVQ